MQFQFCAAQKGCWVRLKNWSIIVTIHDLKGLVRQKILLVFAHSNIFLFSFFTLKDDPPNPIQMYSSFQDVNSIKIRFITFGVSDFHFLFSTQVLQHHLLDFLLDSDFSKRNSQKPNISRKNRCYRLSRVDPLGERQVCGGSP